jgi:hypothetical protein
MTPRTPGETEAYRQGQLDPPSKLIKDIHESAYRQGWEAAKKASINAVLGARGADGKVSADQSHVMEDAVEAIKKLAL